MTQTKHWVKWSSTNGTRRGIYMKNSSVQDTQWFLKGENETENKLVPQSRADKLSTPAACVNATLGDSFLCSGLSPAASARQ